MNASARAIGIIIASLVIFAAAVWAPQFDVSGWGNLASAPRAGELTVIFLDVGQGDAIFIQSPTGRQVLIDGGPDRSVLRELGEVMSWSDRSIDVVIATHPDADHISGLVDVLQRFETDLIIEPGVKRDTAQAQSMLMAVANEGAKEMIAKRGQIIELGDGAQLEILFPDRSMNDAEPNLASIVTRLTYGSTAFMLTGDSPDEIEQYLIALDASKLRADVLKAGHHGSKTSSSPAFIEAVSPSFAVFSRGCDNRYGHPHPDVVAAFAAADVVTYDTCDGRVTFVSDGTSVRKQ